MREFVGMNTPPEIDILFARYVRADRKRAANKREDSPSANVGNRIAVSRAMGNLARAWYAVNPGDVQGLSDFIMEKRHTVPRN